MKRHCKVKLAANVQLHVEVPVQSIMRIVGENSFPHGSDCSYKYNNKQ